MGTFAILPCLIMIIPVLVGRVGCDEKFVDMKIVDEPSNFAVNNYAYGQGNQQLDENLVLRVQPANFSGPQHFRRLLGRCFEAVIQNYKYKFCPYFNFTQHEQVVHWNPYRGVLGVWQEWEVKDNIFVAMLMKDGDTCGNIHRSVRVNFACGNHSEIINVTEPNMCRYETTFMTPLVCAKHSMLVYPTLEPDLQHMWNVLEGESLAGELTKKGYLKHLGKIFEKAGIYLSGEDKNTLVKMAEEEKKEKMNDREFETFSQCREGFKKLQEEVKSLKAQLAAAVSNENATQKNDTVTQ